MELLELGLHPHHPHLAADRQLQAGLLAVLQQLSALGPRLAATLLANHSFLNNSARSV